MHALALITIPKSGTNYLRTLIFNYGRALNGEATAGYREMAAAFPNSVTNLTEANTENVNHPLRRHGIEDFCYQHGLKGIDEYMDRISGPILCLHRNPLDYLVSAYHYFYASRKACPEEITHPRDIIGERLPSWIKILKRFETLTESERVMALSYEQAVSHPRETLRSISAHCGLPQDMQAAAAAASASSPSAAKKYEAERGPIHARDPERALKSRVEGYRFVRSGKIGQWQDVFDIRDVERVRNMVESENIEWDRFVFEDPRG